MRQLPLQTPGGRAPLKGEPVTHQRQSPAAPGRSLVSMRSPVIFTEPLVATARSRSSHNRSKEGNSGAAERGDQPGSVKAMLPTSARRSAPAPAVDSSAGQVEPPAAPALSQPAAGANIRRPGLRRRTARGTMITAAFQIGLAALGLVQRIIVAKLLLPSQYGLWSAVLLAVLTILFLKNAGVGDKFVQQQEADQERAFQTAFSIDLLLALGCVVIGIVALPLVAAVYGKWQIIAPGMVLSLAIVGNSLQAPIWIHYREMNFARQRLLLAIDPCVTFVVTVVLALLGAGVWSLVLGALAGAWTGGLMALSMSPYKPQIRLERSSIRQYFSFSWPLVFASGSGMLIAQGAVLVATRTIGLAGAGGIAVAESVSAFSDGVDTIVTQTLYPAICNVRDRADLLLESFVNPIALP